MHLFERFTDPRDGKTYKTIRIGKQVWMAENLSYEAETSCRIYGDYTPNTLVYGRLYNWDAAMKSCPPGWHIPNVPEVKELFEQCETVWVAGRNLKSKSGWKNSGVKITNSTGFSALPGGGYFFEKYIGLGTSAVWWTRDDDKDIVAYTWYLHEGDSAEIDVSLKECFFSVRCLMD
jgi:uncharacterized protein (TIGR02145 family)